MRNFAIGLVRARKPFLLISPTYQMCFKETKIVKMVLSLVNWGLLAKKLLSLKDSQEVIKESSRFVLSTLFYGSQTGFIRRLYTRAHLRSWQPLMKSNGVGGRNWIDCPENDRRMIKQMRVVFHDANKAGKHIDIHIGSFSLIINISGKPIAHKLKFNSHGELTIQSKIALINLLRSEIKQSARMPQNVDHSIRNTKVNWNVGESGIRGYGSGKTRQIIIEEPVEIMSVQNGSGKTIKMYSPTISNNGLLYIHKLYAGNGKKPPVVIFGKIKRAAPDFADKLNLKKVDTIEQFIKMVDVKTVAVKHDGASSHFETNDKETTFWSPRISKENGERIQYTQKVPELFRVQSRIKSQGLGELLFRKRFNPLNPLHWVCKDRTLTAAEIGGILNANKLRPENIIPDFKIYRMDTWNGINVITMPFFENRNFQRKLARLSEFISLVKLVSPKIKRRWEGLVAVKPGGNILSGIKIRFWGDTEDWEVESINLGFGPTGRTAGVIWFKSLKSSKRFKLGPGQLGIESECLALMKSGDMLIGRVAKVKSRRGHEGRASKFIEWHMDKGAG